MGAGTAGGAGCTTRSLPPRGVSVGVVRCRVSGRRGRPFGGRECLHRQRVDLGAHLVAERGVHPLVPLDTRQAVEISGHDGGKKVLAITFNLKVGAGQASSDEATNVVGGGIGHDRIIADRAHPVAQAAMPPTTAPGHAQTPAQGRSL
jgi:hypothetical protein